MVIEKWSPCLLLFSSTLILAFSVSITPFSSSVGQLAVITSIAEFALGFIDTGNFSNSSQLFLPVMK